MAERMMKLPDELQLALRTIVTLENQELIFILYPEGKLTLEEIQERVTTPSLAENWLRQCIDGLWVTGFYEGGFGESQHFYELTPFGRRLLKGMLDALYIVQVKETLEEKVEREADEKYRDEHGLNFDGSPIVYPGEEEKEEGS